MKIAAGLIGAFIFIWYCVPFLFGAMAKSDYDNLYNGMKQARIAGGSYHKGDEEGKSFVPFHDRYMRGESD